jgi:hypothetical protein
VKGRNHETPNHYYHFRDRHSPLLGQYSHPCFNLGVAQSQFIDDRNFGYGGGGAEMGSSPAMEMPAAPYHGYI